jgi:hypothetical protein
MIIEDPSSRILTGCGFLFPQDEKERAEIKSTGREE